MFIGSINRYMRCVVESSAKLWKGLPVYVACSGNFTIERILHKCGVGAMHSNDVSVYSCAVGWHLAGQSVRYAVKHPDWPWLEAYLEPGLPTIATLLLLSEMLRYKADILRSPDLIARTFRKVQAQIGRERAKLASQ